MPRRLIGLVSDTHGMVRPGLFSALDGVELILHAGDVGRGVLDELRAIAPVSAVYGNTDAPGDPDLSESIEREFDGVRVHVSHGHELGSPRPEKLLSTYDADVIVFGHTHRQLVHQAGKRWVVNPGAAGPRRFDLPASVGLLRIDEGRISVEIVPLDER
ncbi:MAG TPA: metallophosphoesterase family protein [Gemmatimonadaceae bacterium]|nr:metallophosphoesterase family protein [Gemmatimonadaceae bacterium]